MLLVKVIIFVMTAIRNNKYDVYLCHSYNHANGVDIVRDTTIALSTVLVPILLYMYYRESADKNHGEYGKGFR